MDLDFQAIRALSSRSRIGILQELLQREATPSELSNRLDADTSQVMLQLETLSNAGLVEKQEAQQGFGVKYIPTEKARSILNGNETQVQFSIGSSIIAGLAGIGLTFRQLTSRPIPEIEALAEAAPGTTAPFPGPSQGSDILLITGAALVCIAVILLAYGLFRRRLTR